MCINIIFLKKLKRRVNTKKIGSDLYFFKAAMSNHKKLAVSYADLWGYDNFVLLTRKLINP